jgi:cobalt/nickel transport system permease protein
MKRLGPRASRRLLLAWVLGSFLLSAVTQLPALLVGWGVALLVFRRGARAVLRRTLLTAATLTACFVLASLAFDLLLLRRPPPFQAYAGIFLRATLATFLAFAVIARVDLLGALSPWPTPTRLLVITLAQIHALRTLVKESRLGLRSRMPRKPGTRDVLQSGGAVSAAMFSLAERNGREISEAMRSRGF